MSDTYLKLLDLAETETCARGFSAVSYGDLAALAGIRKASIHHHFPTKADLGAALIDRHADHLVSTLASISERARSGGDALRAYLANSRSDLREGKATGLLAALVADAPSLPESVRQPVNRLQVLVAKWLADILQRGRQDRSISVSGNPSDEGRAIFAQVLGAQLAARCGSDPAIFDTASATISARIFRS